MKRKFIWVRWRDAAIASTNYLDFDEKPDPLVIYESCGFLVEDSKDALTLAVSWEGENERWRGIVGIPAECIVKKKIISIEVK
jgi:hypothetical protein